jgi:flagellar hook-basal body complex protein FliE
MAANALRPVLLNQPRGEFANPAAPRRGASFMDTLKDYVGEVSRLDKTADAHVQALAAGKPADPHEIMMAVEQANMALDLLIEVRNRLLETYQELTRTQI